MNSSLVSIIIPVYNTAEYLPQCLDSLLNQTYPHLEILCVDDGSTDNAWAVLQEYAVKDSRVKVFHQENAGVSAARNRALANATGEWLAFIDSDDWLDTDAMERCMAVVDDEIAMVVFSTRSERYGYHSDKVGGAGKTLSQLGKLRIDSNFILRNQMDPKNKIIRSKIIDKYQICFPEELAYAEDCVVGLCVYAGMTMKYGYVLNECFYHYRQREDSAMGQARKKNSKGIQQMYAMNNVYEFMQTHRVSPEFLKVYPVIFWYFVNMALDTTPPEMHSIVRSEAIRLSKEQNIPPVGYMERRLRSLSVFEKNFHWFRGCSECFGILGKSLWSITCQPTEKQYRFMGRLVYSRRYDILK